MTRSRAGARVDPAVESDDWVVLHPPHGQVADLPDDALAPANALTLRRVARERGFGARLTWASLWRPVSGLGAISVACRLRGPPGLAYALWLSGAFRGAGCWPAGAPMPTPVGYRALVEWVRGES